MMVPGFKNLRLEAKINLALVLVFLLVMAALITFTAVSERSLVLDVVEQQTHDTADSYFDSINTMMLTGTMDKRGILREKILSRPGVTEARLIRAEPITKVFGEGMPEQAPQDELDRRALAGESITQLEETEQGRVLTVLNPVRAEKDYRGTNCLLCHMVEEGEVLGAVRVAYSLQRLDQQVGDDLLTSAGIQLVLFALGLGLMILLLRSVVIKPLQRVRGTMEVIERDADLRQRVELDTGDEIGDVARALNSMTGRFRESLEHVFDSTHHLREVAERIASVTDETVKAVLEQRTQTDQVATAMNEMSASVSEVASSATQTAEASGNADSEARNGALVATEALGGIGTLMAEIERAAKVIEKLDQESENIGSVLDVIKGIAEQTNLLALNAAIEAARAGEQGRGFAVVADEVRTLASRTQQSTEEIEQMIDALQQEAREAVSVMGNARGKALEGEEKVEQNAEVLALIAGEVSTINDMNTQIATAADQQSKVAEEINQNVVKIAELADMTSEGARQTAAVTDELVELSRRLNEMVEGFKLH